MDKIKALIHIGGSYLQLASIRWAKELGLYVIVTDRNADSPGSQLADQFEAINGTDVPTLLELAYSVADEHELIGAYCSNDFGLRSVATIAQTFGRPGCSGLAVERALDKSVSKDLWRREDLPVPIGLVVKDSADLSAAVETLGVPVILKPIESSGSQGVRSVWDKKDSLKMYAAARKFSNTVLIEKFVSGHHVDVNGLFLRKDFFPCGIMDRFFSDPPYHYPIWGCQPSSLTEAQEHSVYAIVERAARALGIEEGPVKADIIWTGSGPIILELAPRFHGDVSTAYVTPLATGDSPVKAWMSYLMGSTNSMEYLRRGVIQYAGWIALFPNTCGRLLSVDGVKDTCAIKGIKGVFISKKPGAAMQNATDNTAVCGFVWAAAENRNELFDTLTKARSTIQFVTEK